MCTYRASDAGFQLFNPDPIVNEMSDRKIKDINYDEIRIKKVDR